MTDEKKYWESVEQLLEEANRIVPIEIKYNDKVIKLAWREISEDIELDMEPTDKQIADMDLKETADFNMKILSAEALARIKSAGEQDGCFNKNIITKEIWQKFPKRLRGLILEEIFHITQLREQNFQSR